MDLVINKRDLKIKLYYCLLLPYIIWFYSSFAQYTIVVSFSLLYKSCLGYIPRIVRGS